MDYKKIIKSPETRQKILNLFSFMPDKPMLKLQYFIKQNRKLNLRNPKLYTEKIQWYKIYYKNPMLIKCVDKYEVREYVSEKGLGSILNECYGVFERAEDVDFEMLPDSFVVKDTIGGGSRGVIIITDKAKMDKKSVYEQMDKWVHLPFNKRNFGREWPYYSGKKHRILIEKYIESDPNEGGLVDYKFFCFNGEVKYLYVIADRKMGQNAGIGIYDADYNRLPYNRADERPLEREVPKPTNYDRMIEIARILSKDFPHVRIDLYNIKGQIIFGETTFYPGSGYMQFLPSDFDRILGDEFILPKMGED